MVSWIPSSKLHGALVLGCFVGIALAARGAPFPAEQIEFFEKSVRPVLAENCYSCHGAEKHQNGLRLDSRDAVIKGGDYGKVVEPGNPNPSASKLIRAVKHMPGTEAMPKKGDALRADQISALEKWIALGLPWPEEKAVTSHTEKANWKTHWAFLPVTGGGSAGIDAIIGQKLKAAGLDFAPAAKPETLVRRLYITLTGLPPTFDEMRAALGASDGKNGNYAAVVQSLLVSPRYGERWARHWLDVARYSDTEGYTAGGRDNRYPHAYTYRDWVVKALNDDMPYYKFVTMQLAADKVQQGADPNLAALGFLTINDSFIGDRLLQVDDRIDVVTRGLMGITIGCARCHDHKYDPIKSRDYYALYSVFNSSDEPEVLPVIAKPSDAAAVRAFDDKVAVVEQKKKAFREEVFSDVRKPERLREYLTFTASTMNESRDALRGKAGKAMLRDKIASDWRDFLNAYALGANPSKAMLPWKEFAALPQGEFAARAAEIVKRFTAPDSKVNAVVRNELVKRPAPKSMRDVAAMYADIFSTCLAGTQPDTPEWREVRELLFSKQSPMSVPQEKADEFFTRKDREQFTKFENEIKSLEVSEPGAPLRAMVMVDKPQPSDVRVFVRGNPARQGDPAPRGYPEFLGGQKFTDGSGRLELARLIASKDNPLTARVIVNRVWMLHFGKPLVSQPSDFGVQTAKPEQAELLDHLAATFMEEGWSLKKLHARILTSRTWQQSCESTQEKNLKDPENALLSRMNRQRVDYETMRDAMLAAAGTLDHNKAGGHSTPLTAPEAATRRSVYLFVDRYEQPTVPAMFDFANPDTHSPQRFVTTVPQQSLFLMNSPFMRDQSTRVSDAAQTVSALYRRTLARDASPREMELATRFLKDAGSLAQETPFQWSYGTMRFSKNTETGETSFTDWQPFKVLTEKHGGKTWSHTSTIPDKQWSYAMWSATGGHAGPDDIAPSLRWTATADDTIRVFGKLKKESKEGNGVRGWIISSTRGVIQDVLVKPATEEPVGLGRYEVKKGETLTFAVGSDGNTNNDSFNWVPEIHHLNTDGSTTPLTNAAKDFCDATGWPLNRPKPQSALSQLAQVLLISNEFQFVD